MPLTKEELEDIEKQKELKEDIDNGYMFSKEEYDNLHYEADAVKKLKETRVWQMILTNKGTCIFLRLNLHFTNHNVINFIEYLTFT